MPDTRKLLGLYRVTGTHHDELVALAREASRKGWWEAYSELPEDLTELIGMEAEATPAWNWEPQVIPGLLQTEAYARGVVGAWQEWATVTPAAVERRVEARLTRQRRLEGENPLRLWAVIDESVLSRRFGGNAVMRAQVQHLIDVSQRDNVTLRVLSLDGKQPVGTGAFLYLRFPGCTASASMTLSCSSFTRRASTFATKRKCSNTRRLSTRFLRRRSHRPDLAM